MFWWLVEKCSVWFLKLYPTPVLVLNRMYFLQEEGHSAIVLFFQLHILVIGSLFFIATNFTHVNVCTMPPNTKTDSNYNAFHTDIGSCFAMVHINHHATFDDCLHPVLAYTANTTPLTHPPYILYCTCLSHINSY